MIGPKMIGCNMHSVANCCKNSREALKNVCPDAYTLLEDIKCVFGKPPKSGFVQQDGRKELQLLLKELDGTKTRIFSHDLGFYISEDYGSSFQPELFCITNFFIKQA
ncbi:unnamed protein product [Oikopleura dioica]|uniref:Uncharacterized protein n=1 Tax=Oikopleura dioica TaxID=34765 RepID=E4X267_OIKDI|nr:unnamed protein product [Oikopleura dioica]